MQELKKYNHYYKDVRHLDKVDVYRVLQLFEVTDPCLAAAIKKLLVPGKRGGKGRVQDVTEARDTLNRYLEIEEEDSQEECEEITEAKKVFSDAQAILNRKISDEERRIYKMHGFDLVAPTKGPLK